VGAGQRRVFFEEVRRFVEMTQREQEIRLSGRIPSVGEYWEYRMGTSAVGTLMGLIEYVAGHLRKPRTQDRS
jgi:hypothetical protein